ncbi:MAG: ester cyclase [Planctomycetes bacterium]|nr:ester cyclase [Planctomycetota bacterium]
MSNSTSAKQLTEEWFDRVWNQGDQAAVHEMMCTSCTVKGLPMEKAGPDGFVGIHQVFQSTFDNIKVDIEEIHEIGNRAIGHAHFTGTHKGSGKAVDIIFSFSGEWHNGKVTDARNVIDFAALLTQIGTIKETAVFDALMPA